MGDGGSRVAAVHALHGQAVAGEGVIRLFGDELFEQLAAGFLLVWHSGVSYYTGGTGGVQLRAGQGVGMKRKNTRNRGHETELAGKPVSASRSEMTEIVLPAMTNPLGKLLGGQVMHLVDMAAALAAHRHSNSYVVTASVDYIDFRNPVNLGEIVNLKSQVNRVFHTSMEVGVEVYSENAMTGERKHTTTAYVTFVAVDEHTRLPKLVPPLVVKTAGERRRYREAAERRKTRLALRYGKNSARKN
jgi:acyl-CoA hydrolase